MKPKIYLKIGLFLALIQLLAYEASYSQEYNYDDYEVKNRRYGFGIGFNPFYIMHDFNDLNNSLVSSGNAKLSGNNVFTLGGTFFTYLGFLPNFRFGGFWSTADKSSSNKIENVNKDFDYKYNFWGLSCEYAIPAAKRFSVVGGIMLGSGNQEYEISTKYNEGISWDQIWNPSGETMIKDYKLSLSTNFFIYSPYVMMEYAVWDFLALRIGGGYMGSVKTDLNYEDFYAVKSAPSSLRINNFYFQFGVLTGLFMD